MRRSLYFTLALALLLAAVALGQQKVDQGKPGNQGPWPVTGTLVVVSADGGSGVYAQPCSTLVQSNADAGTPIAIPIPQAGATAGRIWVDICNSLQNASSTQVKCRGDGSAPVFGVGNPGDLLNTGDCVRYNIRAATAAQCIANAVGSWVTATECVP